MGGANYSVTLALLSFFSTTVDDFCVILIFMAREYVKTNAYRDKETISAFCRISIGQVLGFTVIVGVSLVLGIGLHSVVDNDYIALIGLLPVLIGFYKVYELLQEAGIFTQIYKKCCCISYSRIESETEEDKIPAVDLAPENDSNDSLPPQSTFSTSKFSIVDEEEKDEGFEMTAVNIVVIDKNDDDIEKNGSAIAAETPPPDIQSILNEESLETLEALDESNKYVVFAKKMFSFLDPLTFEVALYALMFGTDNIAIYVALFSNVTLLETAGVCVFFYVLLLLYLVLAVIIIIQVCL